MAEQFTAEWAKSIIDDGMQKAQGLVDNPEQINDLLNQLQEKLKELPDTVSTAFSNVPVMAQMVKCYATREYTEVSPKVIISLISAFIYLVKKNDLVSDDIPIVGYADDLVIATVAMAINEPELNAFKAWRDQQENEPIDLVPVENAEVVEEDKAIEMAEDAEDAEPIEEADPADPIDLGLAE